MRLKGSSSRWVNRQGRDRYVKDAKKAGYRARSAYKLLEIQEKDKILVPGQVVVDLGAAPGSWSQVAQKIVGESGQVIALDRLEFDPIPGVTQIIGDFTEEATYTDLEQAVGGREIDVVLCDIAPNASGHAQHDALRAQALWELALEFSQQHLKSSGTALIKVFQSQAAEEFRAQLRACFQSVASRKPESSRSESREFFLLARKFAP